MGLKSLMTEIIDRRIENGARITVEDYTYRAANDFRLSPKGVELAEAAEAFGMTRVSLIAARTAFQAMTKECDERLAREMTAVFTLNKERTLVLHARHMAKGEAAELTRNMGGELLDLDDVYGGLLVRGIHIFVSDGALERGIAAYGEHALSGLIKEQLAA